MTNFFVQVQNKLSGYENRYSKNKLNDTFRFPNLDMFFLIMDNNGVHVEETIFKN